MKSSGGARRWDKAKAGFDEKNISLSEDNCLANAYANVLMPVNNCMGYVLYVIIAVVGGILTINGAANIACFSVGVLTLGAVASFLQLSRSFITISPLSSVYVTEPSAVCGCFHAQRWVRSGVSVS